MTNSCSDSEYRPDSSSVDTTSTTTTTSPNSSRKSPEPKREFHQDVTYDRETFFNEDHNHHETTSFNRPQQQEPKPPEAVVVPIRRRIGGVKDLSGKAFLRQRKRNTSNTTPASSSNKQSSCSSNNKSNRPLIQHNYHDHAFDPVDIMDSNGCLYHHPPNGLNDSSSNTTSSTATPIKKKGGVAIPFPLKLHELLETADTEDLNSIVSWQPHGRAFIVHDPKTFVSELMPRFFRQTKLTSFQRQLNLYGFSRLTRGPDGGGYYHELFLRGKPHLTHRMIRTKIKGTGFKAASNPSCEPDFYGMMPVWVPPKKKNNSINRNRNNKSPTKQMVPIRDVKKSRSVSASECISPQPIFTLSQSQDHDHDDDDALVVVHSSSWQDPSTATTTTTVHKGTSAAALVSPATATNWNSTSHRCPYKTNQGSVSLHDHQDVHVPGAFESSSSSFLPATLLAIPDFSSIPSPPHHHPQEEQEEQEEKEGASRTIRLGNQSFQYMESFHPHDHPDDNMINQESIADDTDIQVPSSSNSRSEGAAVYDNDNANDDGEQDPLDVFLETMGNDCDGTYHHHDLGMVDGTSSTAINFDCLMEPVPMPVSSSASGAPEVLSAHPV